MSNRRQQLREDRALRDAAKALVVADVAHVKHSFSGGRLGKRIASRVSDGAKDVFDEAAEVADSNRGVLAVLASAIVLWFARNPIRALFEDDDSDAQSDEKPEQGAA